jgi:hypothetical protein
MTVPAPVDLDVREVDLDEMRADYLQHCHGIPRPWMFVAGMMYLALAVVKLIAHPSDWAQDWWLWVGAVAFLVFSTRPGPQFPSVERANRLHFSEAGLDVDMAVAGNVARHYPWQRIRAIHDTGSSFVLVPQFGRRIVFPKRSFPDGGREAEAFFAAHGVAGRRHITST